MQLQSREEKPSVWTGSGLSSATSFVQYTEVARLILARLLVALAVLAAIVYVAYVGLAIAAGVPVGDAVAQAASHSVAYAAQALTGDLGMSTAATSTRNPIAVTAVAGTFMVRSLALLALALALASMVGVPLGIIAARQRHRVGADLLLLLSIVGVSAPSFHFGFPLWFFAQSQVDSIVRVVFDEWGIGTE